MKIPNITIENVTFFINDNNLTEIICKILFAKWEKN